MPDTVSRTYVHTVCGKVCGTVTSLPSEENKTYVAVPNSYGITYCVSCDDYRPVSEFVWG